MHSHGSIVHKKHGGQRGPGEVQDASAHTAPTGYHVTEIHQQLHNVRALLQGQLCAPREGLVYCQPSVAALDSVTTGWVNIIFSDDDLKSSAWCHDVMIHHVLFIIQCDQQSGSLPLMASGLQCRVLGLTGKSLPLCVDASGEWEGPKKDGGFMGNVVFNGNALYQKISPCLTFGSYTPHTDNCPRVGSQHWCMVFRLYNTVDVNARRPTPPCTPPLLIHPCTPLPERCSTAMGSTGTKNQEPGNMCSARAHPKEANTQ